MCFLSSFLNAYLKFGCVLKIILKWKWKKKKKIIETDSHWTTKESGADRKGEMQHCGWYCFNLCVCVCDMPSLHSVFLVLPFLMSHCLCFLFFFNLCVVCVCVCLGIALHSCPFNQLTSSTNSCSILWLALDRSFPYVSLTLLPLLI